MLSQFFKAKSDGLTIEDNYRINNIPVPQLVADAEEYANLKTTMDDVENTLLVSFLLPLSF